jgi:hypothetical protein
MPPMPRRGLNAIAVFYADDASMQENQSTPRVGKPALLEHERKALAAVKSLQSRCVRPFFIEGELVVIKWRFEYESLQGQRCCFEELSHQTWRGAQIRTEQFFYDPAQFTPRS